LARTPPERGDPSLSKNKKHPVASHLSKSEGVRIVRRKEQAG